jgi:hypothetical protein
MSQLWKIYDIRPTRLSIYRRAEVIGICVPHALQSHGAKELADDKPAVSFCQPPTCGLLQVRRSHKVYALMKNPLSCVGATSER